MKYENVINIIKQIIFASLNILLSFAAVYMIFMITGNAIAGFIDSLLIEPLIIAILSAISVILLKSTDIYFPIMISAIIIYLVYMVCFLGMSYIIFVMLELCGFIIGCYIGKSIRTVHIKKKQEKTIYQ